MRFETDKVIKDIINEKDRYLIQFLTDNGYRPKPTIKYIDGLIKRLKRNGLKLNYYENIEYSKPETSVNGTTYKGKLNMLFKIEKESDE